VLPGTWMSFFGTEEARAFMPARVADEGGRAAPQEIFTSPPMEVCGGDRHPPRSAGESRLNATASFGAKKTSISLQSHGEQMFIIILGS
jgi:hypothetical protein